MRRAIIAVDIDEVLLPHFKDLILWYNEQFGTSLTLSHNHPTDPKPWGTDNIRVAIRRVHQFYDTPAFKNAKPFLDAIDILTKLNDKFDLVVITARDTIIEDITREWLEIHFPGLFKETHFTSMYSLEGKSRSKASVAVSIKASYLIDDDIGHIKEAAKHNIKGILFGNYDWNSSIKELPKDVVRAVNWKEVADYFNGKT